jgi:formate-dependent nitrite reductase cytochrome c552 subunit
MKVRRLDKLKEPLGYCNDCHNRAAIEITFKAGRPPIYLCARDARYMIKHVAENLNNNHRNHTAK